MKIKNMNYPKLPKKLNRACKLTEQDIETVFSMRKMGITLKAIGQKFGMTQQGIHYVLKTPEQKKQINWKRHQRDTENDRIRANRASSEARKYKRDVLAEQMKNAQRIMSDDWRKKHPDYNKEADKKHYYKKEVDGRWLGAIERRKYPKYLSTPSTNK